MTHTKRNKAGFTLVEIMVVIAIMGLMVGITTETFLSMHQKAALRIARNEVRAAFRDSRTNTLAAKDDVVFGVRVSTSSVTRFRGAAYDPVASTNEMYIFEGGVSATGTLVESATDIVFTRLTGKPGASGVITLLNRDGSASSSVAIYASGLIE